ncbi:MAG TPA: hypothetical protein VNN73_15705 [Blastocatellia bacterium]|nr:hypothetical protein [Blastocatellia bacterium]
MSQPEWMMRIRGYLSAHFFQPDGTSRPGTDWSVELIRGNQVFPVMVRTYLSDDMSRAARADMEFQGRTVLGFISDLLAEGWMPDQPRDLTIVIQNPPESELARSRRKPWWKFW